MTSLPISNHMFQPLHFTPRIPAHFTKCVEAYFVSVCVFDWGREWECVCVCVCLLGADGWPSVEGRVGGGLLLLWQVKVDSWWIQMRLSPSLFHSLLRSLASTPTCTNTDPYGCAPYTPHTSTLYTASPRLSPLQQLAHIHTQTEAAAYYIPIQLAGSISKYI